MTSLSDPFAIAKVITALKELDGFVDALGDAPMGGESLVSREWTRARNWIIYELNELQNKAPK